MTVRTIIDQQQVKRNRQRALRMDVAGADFLFERLLEDLTERLDTVARCFDRALYIGPQGARVASQLKQNSKVRALHCIGDEGIDDAMLLAVGATLEAQRYDLIVTLGVLHETNDTPGILAQLRRAMVPDGLLIAAMPGAETLVELRDSLLRAELELGDGASTRVLPFMDVRAAGSLLQRAGFALPVTDLDSVTVRYGSMIKLMLDLRAMGAGNTLHERSKHMCKRQLFGVAQALYAQNHADEDGRMRATFCFIWMSGWAPADSQPKPLRPGSATVSLADALKQK